MTWRKINLETVLSSLESGSRPMGGASCDSGEIPSLGGENIRASGGITLKAVKLVPSAFHARMTKGHLQDGDVLINKDGAQTGKVGLYRAPNDVPACINEHVFLLRGNPDWITQEYLYYTLLSEPAQRQIRSEISGSAQPGLKSGFVRGIWTEIPTSPPEQSKIAEILSTVDRAIEQTEAVIAKQQRIKTGLMQDLLTRGIDEHGNLRTEETHEFKDSPLGRIPVEWEVEQLGKFTEFVTSGARGWAKYYRDEGAIFLRIGNLTRDHLNLHLDDLVYVKPPVSAEGRRTCVLGGDLLISVTADLGIIGVIPSGFGEGYVNQHIALARPNHSAVCSRFIGWFFESHQGQSQFDRLNESGAKAGLNLPTVRSLLFPKPECAEQTTIAAILDASVVTLDGHLQNQRKLIALKTGLMQDLLTGKVRVASLLESKTEAIA